MQHHASPRSRQLTYAHVRQRQSFQRWFTQTNFLPPSLSVRRSQIIYEIISKSRVFLTFFLNSFDMQNTKCVLICSMSPIDMLSCCSQLVSPIQGTCANRGIGLRIVTAVCNKFDGDVVLTGEASMWRLNDSNTCFHLSLRTAINGIAMLDLMCYAVMRYKLVPSIQGV